MGFLLYYQFVCVNGNFSEIGYDSRGWRLKVDEKGDGGGSFLGFFDVLF